ncbi:dihydrolipoyl dehydrogenase family protein [Endomicrobium proavitum]|uniref:Dihydrolipoyl dehydrogenase n=1 Tax=Endomicrobium proavitum TaxID=1408281 RepID=A0A0G3WIE9_9BACT|nr:NAD(P)/FAD-dependent oxidoreductase [Endomicrobium proavitum]AKL97660.1 Glycine cleavage system L protein [Endomicrobium proavitum]
MSFTKYDVAVIGSGPGGFSAAVRAAQLGAKVALIEKSLIGGTCLNCGCMPTKFLWQSLNAKQKIRKADAYGFKANLEVFNFSDIIAKKDKTIANLRKGMELILSSYGIDIIKGSATFKSKDALEVLDENNKTDEVRAEKIIIASGSKPAVIKGFAFDGKKIISSTDVLNLKELPKTILIVGGGAIGVEMAAIFAGFGSQVTIAEYAACLMPSEDSEISAEINKNLQRAGVEVLTACTDALNNIDKYEKVLIVTGRAPNDSLEIENAGIKTDKKGFIKTDSYCKTNVDNIYAVGDIAGKNLLAYTAQSEGEVAAENAVKGSLLENSCVAIPQVVFSAPPAACVKIKDFESYKNIVYGKIPFTASGRAFIENERTGFVKCAVDADSKKTLAFWIVGAHADELINTAAQIIKSGKIPSREDFFHPSLSESLYNAYEDAFGKSTETAKISGNR